MGKRARIALATLLITITLVCNYLAWDYLCPPFKDALGASLKRSPPQGLLSTGILFDALPVLVTLARDGTFKVFLIINDAKRACPISGSDWDFFYLKIIDPGQPV